MKFNVTTFNLRLNTEVDQGFAWPNRKDSVVKYFKQSDSYIVGVQEALPSMIQDLESQLPYYRSIGTPREPNGEATCIFYRTDMVDVIFHKTFWLSKTPSIPFSKDYGSRCIRICTYAEFLLKKQPNLRFRVFNTHLDHISDQAKIEGIKLIVTKINELNKEDELPSILMGDFNSTRQDAAIHFLDNSTKLNSCFNYKDQTLNNATFHGFSREVSGDPIDHIYLSRDIRLLDTEIYKHQIDNQFLSDHYPVTCKIKLDSALLTASYHTHNFRCGHASGTVDDYVKQARKLGLKTIGITDHLPFEDNRFSQMRMEYKLIHEYLDEIKKAKASFDDMNIYSGFECEYFKSMDPYFRELKEQVDFLILGQHYIENKGGDFTGIADFPDHEALLSYANHIKEAVSTGLFSLVAHPDSFGLSYREFDKFAVEASHVILDACREYDVAIEINSNGIRRKNKKYRNKYPYPIKEFWEIVKNEYSDLKVVITADAHSIKHLNDFAVREAFRLAKDLNLTIVDTIEFK